MSPDIINALFEVGAGSLLWMNVWKLHKDKAVKGVSIIPTIMFTLWGYWNLYYYPHLGQWYSFLGGLNIVAANSVWAWQMFRYREKK